jgi:hypothetical protein
VAGTGVKPSQVTLVCDVCERVITLASPDCGKIDCDEAGNWARLTKAAGK